MAQSFADRINVDIKSVKDLRAAIREYQDSLIGVNAESEEFKTTTENLRAAQYELNKVTKAGKEAYDAADDSIVGMERHYKELYNQYKLLSEEQRNSDFGKNMAASLNQLSEKLNETKKGVGNWKDNIGRYTESVMDAFSKMGGSVGGLVGPFKTATQGITAFNTALKANPVGAVITLIMSLVSVIKQLAGSIKDNEESQMRLNQAMAAFQPIIDATKNAFDKVGQAIVSVVEFLSKAVDKFRVAKAAITDFLGITKGAKDAVKEQQKTYQDLAKSVNDLTKTKREYQKANAEDKAEVERLREEASETTNLTEKKKLLEEAKAKQAEIDQRNIEVAKEELRILEIQDGLTANSAEDNEKLAAAVAKVSEAEATAAANMRMFNRQLSGTESSTKGAVTSMKNLREEAKKLYEQTIENSKTEIQKLTEKYDKELALLKKYHYDTTELTKQYNKQIEKLQAEAIKTAAEKASSVYIEAAKNRIGKGGEFNAITEALQEKIDGVLLNVRQMQAKKAEYDEFLKNFFSIDFNMVGALTSNKIKEGEDLIDEASTSMIDQAKDFVKEINSVLGTEIQFPPKMSKENMDKFAEDLKNAQFLFDLAIKRMEASAEKADFERTLENKLSGTGSLLEERINTLREFRTGEETERQERLGQITDQEIQLEIKYYTKILELENLSDAERIEARQNLYAALEEQRQRDLEKEQAALDQRMGKLDLFSETMANISETFNGSSTGLINLANGYKTLYNAQIQEGKLNEKEVNARKNRMKDLEKVVLAATVAQIAASTAQGMVDTWTGYIKETSVINPQTAQAAGMGSAAALAILNGVSLAKAISKSVGLAATAAGQIAAARGNYISNVTNLQSEGSAGSAAASVAAPTEPDYVPFQYTRQVQTFAEEDELNRPLWISVVDIDRAQDRVQIREEESSF